MGAGRVGEERRGRVVSTTDLDARASALRGVARAIRAIDTTGLTRDERRELDDLYVRYLGAAVGAEAVYVAAVEALRAAEVAA